MTPATRISTVVTPANSYALVDLTTLKLLLNVSVTTYDAYFNLLISQFSQTVQTFCNNAFVVDTRQDQIFPPRDGWPWTVRTEIAPLQLSRWNPVFMPDALFDVLSVVEIQGITPTTLVAGTDYLVDPTLGQLTRLDTYGRPRNWHANPVTVQWEVGYPTIPGDLVNAIVQLVDGRWSARQRDPLLKREEIPGVRTVEYWVASDKDATGDLPPAIEAALTRYRTPVFA